MTMGKGADAVEERVWETLKRSVCMIDTRLAWEGRGRAHAGTVHLRICGLLHNFFLRFHLCVAVEPV